MPEVKVVNDCLQCVCGFFAGHFCISKVSGWFRRAAVAQW